MVSMYLLIPLSLMLFVIGIWAVRYAVKSNQFEDLDNESQRVILDDRQERRQTLASTSVPQPSRSEQPKQASEDSSNQIEAETDHSTLDTNAKDNDSDA